MKKKLYNIVWVINKRSKKYGTVVPDNCLLSFILTAFNDVYLMRSTGLNSIQAQFNYFVLHIPRGLVLIGRVRTDSSYDTDRGPICVNLD